MLNKNKLVSLYQEIATNIWNRIPFSYKIGFRYSEVTITENLLFEIYKFNINNPSLAVNIFEAKNEKANGNDLELCLEIEPDKYIILVIQAKKLYFSTQKYRSISHKVNDEYQINLLEDYAKQEKAIPLYMFYNYAPSFKNKHKEYYGCSLIFSKYIKDNYYPKSYSGRWKIPSFDELHQKHHAIPLHALALNGLKIKKTIDNHYKEYEFYTKNVLVANDKWIEIFDKTNQDYSKYISDEFEPKYRIIIGENR